MAQATDPRIRSECEVREIAKKAQCDPGALTASEVRALALYVWQRQLGVAWPTEQ